MIIIDNVTIRIGKIEIIPEPLTSTRTHMINYYGPTGSGKTVLLKTLAGIGKEIHGYTSRGRINLWNPIWYVPQEPWPIHIGTTTGQELMFVKKLTKSNIEEKEIAEITVEAGILDKKIIHMSYGERRILEFIKAYVVQPHTLIIDEPYENLDKRKKTIVSKIIRKIIENNGYVIASSKRPLNGWINKRIIKKPEIKLEENLPDIPCIKQGRIKINNGYIRRGKKTIKIPEIDLSPGSVATILGENGSGKTSLLLALSGAIKIHGDTTIIGQIGFIPDDVSTIFSWMATWEVIKELCNTSKACINKTVNALNKLSINVDDKYFQELSDGEKRIILLLSNIYSGKSILLLDSGLENIDYQRAKIMISLINEFIEQGGIAILTQPSEGSLHVREGISEASY